MTAREWLSRFIDYRLPADWTVDGVRRFNPDKDVVDFGHDERLAKRQRRRYEAMRKLKRHADDKRASDNESRSGTTNGRLQAPAQRGSAPAAGAIATERGRS